MKTALLLVVLIFTVFALSLYAQQTPFFNLESPVNQQLLLQPYSCDSFCPGKGNTLLLLKDSSLTSYVEGLSLVFVVGKLQAPANSISFNGQNVTEGDTFWLNQSALLHFSLSGSLDLVLKAIGTPALKEQTFPCHIETRLITGTCNDTLTVFDSQNGWCLVNTLSEIEKRALAFNMHGNNIKIYPNPTEGELNIEFDESKNDEKIEILDLLGVIVFETPYHKTINIGALQRGVYFLRIMDRDNRLLFMVRIIKK